MSINPRLIQYIQQMRGGGGIGQTQLGVGQTLGQRLPAATTPVEVPSIGGGGGYGGGPPSASQPSQEGSGGSGLDPSLMATGALAVMKALQDEPEGPQLTEVPRIGATLDQPQGFQGARDKPLPGYTEGMAPSTAMTQMPAQAVQQPIPQIGAGLGGMGGGAGQAAQAGQAGRGMGLLQLLEMYPELAPKFAGGA